MVEIRGYIIRGEERMELEKSKEVDYALGITAKEMGNPLQDFGFVLHDYDNSQETKIRGGIPNVLESLEQGRKVIVGYLGGSITLQEGWRPRTTAWLKSKYPKADIIEINAAVNGTGADFGAARIEEHLLVHAPDLVFIEFAINGGRLEEMEGIVRKIWRKNPDTDIVLVYTVTSEQAVQYAPASLPSFPSSLQAFETVAAHYDIPSIFFGYVVGELISQNKLIPRAIEDPDSLGLAAFSRDGIHPLGAGDQLYAGAVARSIVKMQRKERPPISRVLKESLCSNNWELASMCDAAFFARELDVWETNAEEFEAKFPYKGTNWNMVRSLFPKLVVMKQPGDSVTVRFTGTNLGIADVGGPFSGMLSVVVDGKPPITVNRFTCYSANLRHQIFFLPEMEEGVHLVTFNLMEESPDKRSILQNEADFDKDPASFRSNEVYLAKILVK